MRKKNSIYFGICMVALLIIGTLCRAEKLYVFYPTTIRPKVIKQKLSTAFPGIDITVFGRYRDFKARIEQAPPDAILTKTPLVGQFDGFQLKYQGVRNGKTKENYFLLSINKELDANSSEGVVIGAVDFLGRKAMQTFVAEFFKKAPKIKRVTKLEDLLPLMTFNMANGILITEKEVSYFKRISNLDFKVTRIAGRQTGIVALAVKKNQKNGTIQKNISKMPDETKLVFGVEKWKGVL